LEEKGQPEFAGLRRIPLHQGLAKPITSAVYFFKGSLMKRLFEIFKSAMDGFSEDRCWTFSASLSYYAVFSLPWILLIVVYVAGKIVGEGSAASHLQASIQSIAGSAVADQIQTMIRNASRPGGHGVLATLVSIGAIIVSSTTAFAELQFALNQAWEVQPDESNWTIFLGKRVISFLMVIGMGFVLLASMALRALAAGPARLPTSGLFGSVWETVLAWLIVTVLVGAILKVLPDAAIATRDVVASALLTGALLTASKYGMSIYLAHSSVASSFGAAGALAILMIWLYISSAILLFGAEFARAWSRARGRDVVPQPGAVRIREQRAA
jgi:membrane protein